MEKPKNTRSWFIGIALGTLFALCLWPTTRGLIQGQLLSLLPFSTHNATLRSYMGLPGAAADAEVADRRLNQAVRRHPDDAALQFADAIRARPNDTPATRWERLTGLISRFPDSPSMHSNVLRIMTLRDIRMAREEGNLLVGERLPSQTSKALPGSNTSEHLATFDRVCEAGEDLDPDNAAFPFLRAIGLFAAHRDKEALEALHRAATKPRWEEYARDQVEGQWRLMSEANGKPSAVLKVAVGAGLLLPQYSQFRSVARVATWKAVEAEQAGRMEEGLAIRRSLQQIGGLMRVQAPCLIGNLIGIAITKSSLSRPGGAPYVKFNEETRNGEEAESRLRDYETWLQTSHLDLEANSPRAEVAAGVRVKELLTNPDNPAFGGEAFRKLIGFQIGTALTLSNALWLFLLGGAAVLKLGTHSASRRRQRLITGVLGVGFVAVGICFVNGQLLGDLGIATRILTSLLPGVEADIRPVFQGQELPLLVLLGGAVPLLTLLIIGGISIACRVPLSVGVARGLRGCAPVIGCALLLAYSGLIIGMARQEKIVMTGMERTLQHEGRYLMELNGKEWPGPVW
jgi:hypothetical protein